MPTNISKKNQLYPKNEVFSLAKLSTIISIINLTNVTARFVGQVYVESSPPKRGGPTPSCSTRRCNVVSRLVGRANVSESCGLSRVTKMAATWTGGHSRATLHFRDNSHSSSKREDPLIAAAGLWIACFATLSRQHSLSLSPETCCADLNPDFDVSWSSDDRWIGSWFPG